MGTSMTQQPLQGHSTRLFQSEEEPRYAPQGEGWGRILAAHPGGPLWFSPTHSPTSKYRTRTYHPAVVLLTSETTKQSKLLNEGPQNIGCLLFSPKIR